MAESSIARLSRRLGKPVPDSSTDDEQVPVTLAQQLVVRQHRAGPLDGRAVAVAAWSITPAPEPDALASAVGRLMTECAVLRTIHPADRPVVEGRLLDPDAVAVEDVPPVLDHIDAVLAYGARPIDIASDAPFRVAARTEGEHTLVVLSLHAVAGDELLLRALINRLAVLLDDPGAPHARFDEAHRALAEAELEAAGAAGSDPDLAYWLAELDGLPPTSLRPLAWRPAAGAGAEAPGGAAGPGRTGAVASLAPDLGGEAVDVAAVVSAIAAALYDEWALDDLVIAVGDTATSGDEPAPHVNRLLCRIRPDAGSTARRLRVEVERTLERGRVHRSTRFEQIMLHPATGRPPSVPPQVATLAAVGPDRIAVGRHRLASVGHLDALLPGVDLGLTVIDGADGPALRVTMADEVAALHDVSAWAGRIAARAAALVTAPENPLGQHPLVPEPEPEPGADGDEGEASAAAISLDAADPDPGTADPGAAEGDGESIVMWGVSTTPTEVASTTAALFSSLEAAGWGEGSVIACPAAAPYAPAAMGAAHRLGAVIALVPDVAEGAPDPLPAALGADVALTAGPSLDPAADLDATFDSRLRATGAAMLDIGAAVGAPQPTPSSTTSSTVSAAIPPISAVAPDRTALLVPAADGRTWVGHSYRSVARYVATEQGHDPVLIVSADLAAGQTAVRVIAALAARRPLRLVTPTAVTERETALVVAAHTGELVVGWLALVVVAASADAADRSISARRITVDAATILDRHVVPPPAVPPSSEVAVSFAPDSCGPIAVARRSSIDDLGDGPGLGIGSAVADAEIRVAHPDGRPLPDGMIGRVDVGRRDEVDLRPTGFTGFRAADGTVRLAPPTPRRRLLPNGEQLDLDRLEERLTRHPDVLVATVQADDDEAKPTLDVHVVPNPGADGAILEIVATDELGLALGDPSVARTVTVVAEVPLTAVGTLDVDALPDPASARLSGFGGPPRTPTEEAVVEAVRAALLTAAAGPDIAGLDRRTSLDELAATSTEIGREDNFFGLGGDSLAALQVITILQDAGHPAEVETLFLHPMLSAFAREIDDARAAGVGVDTGPTEAAPPMSASGLDADGLADLLASLNAEADE
ncbi:MAG: phosphopantetheine-binding protein [Actinomycetota bacterium]